MAEVIEISRVALHDQVVARLRKMLVEAKFGPSARLSRNHRVAHDALGRDGYRIDSFLPRDVGAVAAFPAAIIGVQFGGR